MSLFPGLPPEPPPLPAPDEPRRLTADEKKALLRDEVLDDWDLEDLLSEAGYPSDKRDLIDEILYATPESRMDEWLRDAEMLPPLPTLCAGTTDPAVEREAYLSKLPTDVAERVRNQWPSAS